MICTPVKRQQNKDFYFLQYTVSNSLTYSPQNVQVPLATIYTAMFFFLKTLTYYRKNELKYRIYTVI